MNKFKLEQIDDEDSVLFESEENIIRAIGTLDVTNIKQAFDEGNIRISDEEINTFKIIIQDWLETEQPKAILHESDFEEENRKTEGFGEEMHWISSQDNKFTISMHFETHEGEWCDIVKIGYFKMKMGNKYYGQVENGKLTMTKL
jgi:hypothetical protein